MKPAAALRAVAARLKSEASGCCESGRGLSEEAQLDPSPRDGAKNLHSLACVCFCWGGAFGLSIIFRRGFVVRVGWGLGWPFVVARGGACSAGCVGFEMLRFWFKFCVCLAPPEFSCFALLWPLAGGLRVEGQSAPYKRVDPQAQ